MNQNEEQMEAMKEEFKNLWLGQFRPRLIGLGVKEHSMPSHYDIAWQAFHAARE